MQENKKHIQHSEKEKASIRLEINFRQSNFINECNLSNYTGKYCTQHSRVDEKDERKKK